ncbi:MAG: PAS domain S-box protein, partial [Nevskiales bacterium]
MQDQPYSDLVIEDSPRRAGWLRDLSITTKLAAIVVVNIAILFALLGIVMLCLNIASGVRAYVGGEGLWSKGQKDAVYYLSRYALTRDEQDHLKYQQAISIPLGDRNARLELLKPEYDYAVVERGFIEGGNAAEDVPDMVFLFRRFGRFSYLARAIRIWTKADIHIARLIEHADELHAAIQSRGLTPARERRLRNEIERINAELTWLERDFSATLGEGARWIQAVLLSVVLVSAVLLLAAGLWLSLRLSRELRGGILRLHEGAAQVASGNLAYRIAQDSRDELGQLATAFNTMIEHRQQAETALKTSMEQARSVIETAFDAFIGMDAGGRICEWNRQAEIALGWSRQEVMGHMLAERIIPPALREAHQRGLDHYLRTGEGPILNRRIEITALHRDGHEFPIELAIWPIQVAGTQRFNAFLHDISERHRMMRRLDAQKAAAAALVGASTLAEAAPAVLDAICEALEWDVGAIWVPDAEADVLRCVQIRHRAGREIPAFMEISRKITFPRGIGLPGRVWTSGKPAWIADVT